MPVQIITSSQQELANKLIENIDFIEKNRWVKDTLDSKLFGLVRNIQNNDLNLVINSDDVSIGRVNFLNAYSNQNDLPIMNDITVKWKDFKAEVLKSNINTALIVLNFIHRYDVQNSRWYLCVECCEREANSGDNNPDYLTINKLGHYIYKITNRGYRYDINNGNISESDLSESFDADYFSNVKENGQALDVHKHVNSIAFPWVHELIELYKSSGLDEGDNTYIKFASSSFDYGTPDPAPAQGSVDTRPTCVRWPHGIMIFMNNAGSDLLDNNHGVTIFSNKACNYGSMLPPRSNDYFWPNVLRKS